ncbi:MAG TPA: NYN domain-containing protein [Nocardioides sp.]|nr:NYN domain-containing protein [Nocardioides sp.]
MTTTRSSEPPVTRTSRPWRRHRWPVWAGYAAGAWSLGYGLLGLYWTLGGAGFPFGMEHDKDAKNMSLLEYVHQDTTAPVIAAVGLGGALLAFVMTHRQHRSRSATALAATSWTMAAGLAIVIPDYRPLLAVVRAPVLLIGAPFGWPEQVGLKDFFPLFLPWPVANQLLLICGGILWAAAAVAFQRRSRDSCADCGRADLPAGWATPAAAARWGRRAVYVAVAVPIGYAMTRWAFALDIPLGVSREGLHKEARESPGIWLGGAILATMGAGGAALTLGLVQRWGEVYPRWVPRLRGKPVRPRTAIIPASLVAILITSAGLMWVRWLVLGRFHLEKETWGLFAPQLFWPLWGAALGVATLAYYLRRRGPCAYCRRS